MSMDSEMMGSMSMGDGVPNLFYMQRIYWIIIGAAVGVATFVNLFNTILLRQRLAICGGYMPARPRSFFFQTFATSTAMIRELSNTTVPSLVLRRLGCSPPTLGRTTMILGELTLVMVLCFARLDPTNQWQWEDIAYRTGFIAAAQLPLVILLAGKNNIIGILVGSSYEKLNWLHRWVSRILFLTVTIHMGFWFRSWARYDYIMVKLNTDPITQRGFAAWCILLWIVLSSLAPIRRWNYEFFVIQHIVTSIGFLAAVFLHLPAEVKMDIWIPIALYIFDRIIRTAFIIFVNLSIFHPKSKTNGFWTCLATLEPLACDTARITINDPPISWRPGQHVYFSCHGIAPLQSHPFTIASLPEDRRMEFLVKSKAGATKRFFLRAEGCQSLPTSQKDPRPQQTFSAVIDGPYGRMRALRQFDSVFLIAGSSGGSFTVPLMRDIVSSWKQPRSTSVRTLHTPPGSVTRYIRFVWVVKHRNQCTWFASQLSKVMKDVQQLCKLGHGVEVDMSIYVTCNSTLDAETSKIQKSKGPPIMHDEPEAMRLSTPLPFRKEDLKGDNNSMHYTSSTVIEDHPTVGKSCGPDGTCCCANTIEDEDAIEAADTPHQCCCCDKAMPYVASPVLPVLVPNMNEEESKEYSTSASVTSRSSVPPVDVRKQSMADIHIDPSISILTGRPHPKTLIRKTLEQALGESAVVVCGPRGLNEDVRRSVVSLSDERAVHKGTGAQGIYLWEEGFEY